MANIPQGPAAVGRARRLRREGVVRGAVGLVAAALLALWKPPFAAVVAAIALVVLALAIASPLGAYGRLSGWIERFARGVGTAVTWILMPLLFYGLFLPVGLLLRAGGKLRLTRAPDPARPSYWTEPAEGRGWGGPPERYRKQF